MTALQERTTKANEDYQGKLAAGIHTSIPKIEKAHSLKPGQLTWHRQGLKKKEGSTTEEDRELLLLANADYDNEHHLRIRQIERYWGLRAGALRHYRSNISRK